MEHKLIQNRLSAYLDGEMATQERAALEQHLAGCEQCSAIISDMRTIAEALQKATSEQSSGLAQRVQRRVELQMRRRAERFVGWLSALAASIALAAGIHLVQLQQTPRAPVGWEGQAVQLTDDPDNSRKVVMAQWFVTDLSHKPTPQHDSGAAHE